MEKLMSVISNLPGARKIEGEELEAVRKSMRESAERCQIEREKRNAEDRALRDINPLADAIFDLVDAACKAAVAEAKDRDPTPYRAQVLKHEAAIKTLLNHLNNRLKQQEFKNTKLR